MSTSCPIPGCNAATMASYLNAFARDMESRRFDLLNADELEALDAYPEAAQLFLLALAQMQTAAAVLQLAKLKLHNS